MAKKNFLPKFAGDAQMRVMREYAPALDPNGILNPGKMFDVASGSKDSDMALATTTVSFSNEPPTMEALEIKLAAATGFGCYALSSSILSPPTETWYFNFSSQIDKFSRSIKCNRNGRKFSVYEADNVNRCPLYFLLQPRQC